ncbi:MAG TPA: hypothetical protein VFV50_03700 [Bdellovibrionales bacterium]|nr:hypothetical protein [Bdellovibrionales bacterium]
MPRELMRPFPLLSRLSGTQIEAWGRQLMKELGGDGAVARETLQSYFPMWLKRSAKSLGLEPYVIEIADYEWSLYWAREIAPSGPLIRSRPDVLTFNPLARILRLEFDILEWAASGGAGVPRRGPNILALAGDVPLKATFEMAAVLDVLAEQPCGRDDLIENLKREHGARDWSGVLDQLVGARLIF